MAKTQGLEKLKAQIRAIPAKVAGQMSEGIGAAAYDLADAIQSHAPRREGALANSVDYCAGDPPADAKMGAADKSVPDPLTAALSESGLRYSVFAGDDRAFYARWVEFGTRASTEGDKVTSKDGRGGVRTRTAKRTHPGTKAQPFFYPTIRARMSRTKTAVSRAVNKALKDAAKSG